MQVPLLSKLLLITLENEKYPTVVVGHDADLLVLLTALANKDLDIWYLKLGKSGSTHKLYNIQTEKPHMVERCDILLFFMP